MAIKHAILMHSWHVPVKSYIESPQDFINRKKELLRINKEFTKQLPTKDSLCLIISPSITKQWEDFKQYIPEEAIVFSSKPTHNTNYVGHIHRLQLVILDFSKTGLPIYDPEI